MSTFFQEISVKGLIGEITDEVRKVRGTASRNSIYRALQDDRTKEERSPLRNYIIEVAEKILAKHKQAAALEAESAAVAA